MSPAKTLWTKNSTKDKEAILVGDRINDLVLDTPVQVIEMRFGGELQNALRDLWQAGLDRRCYLPVTKLRTALAIHVNHLISVDRDLGLSGQQSPMRFFAPADQQDEEELREMVRQSLKNWSRNVVQVWAQQNEMGEIAARMDQAISLQNVLVSPVIEAPIRTARSFDFVLLSRYITRGLSGEELFPGLGPCEIVASERDSNSVELMTKPVHMPGKRPYYYSMVARLTISTLPYCDGVFVVPSTIKRVWASRMPSSAKVMRKFTGYVYSPGRMVMPFTVVRAKNEWKLDDDYDCVQVASLGGLPTSLEELVQRRFEEGMTWWAGIPQLTTLYGSTHARSTFEGDEVDLMHAIRNRINGMLKSGGVSMRKIDLDRQRGKTKSHMLTETDLKFGVAGDANMLDESDEEPDQATAIARSKRILEFQQQNQKALEKDVRERVIWVFCDFNKEASLIELVARKLFGDGIDIRRSALPGGSHGLKSDLPGSDLKMDERFNLRLQAWTAVAKQVEAQSKGKLPIVMICAAKQYGGRSEEELNMYAGIHAMSMIGANVHHLLPIENNENQADRDHFVHRTQSALIDVMLAHSGIVFGVQQAIASIYGESEPPNYIYGVQTTRSRARKYTSEVNVDLIAYSRISVKDGVTEFRFAYQKRGETLKTSWMILSEALSWMGSQRDICGGEDWLKGMFATLTKEVLAEIVEEDPRGVVMIDWATTRSLWKGIRDEDMRGDNKPTLDGTSLDMFGDLSFIRIRREPGTMALRQSITNSYTRITEGTEAFSGEQAVLHNYYTTLRSLVEVLEHGTSAKPSFGTFVGTMGYAKTVQVPRGFSCYRPMKRYKKAQGNDFFEEDELDIGDLTAALPAPTDYTVLRCPSFLQPEQVAMIPLNLRIGFAHYDDWTALPAPLFFINKIRDYIIRYSELDDTEPEGVEQLDDAAGQQPTQLKLELTEDDLLLDLDANDSTKTEEAYAEQVSKIASQPEAYSDIMEAVRENAQPNLWRSSDRQIFEKYTWLLRCAIWGTPKVNVELPYFVDINTVYGEMTPLIKRNMSKLWRELRHHRFIPKTMPMPTTANFLKTLARALRVPQGARGIGIGTRTVGGLGIEPLWQIVNTRYNASVEPQDRCARNDFTLERFKMLMEYALTHDDDEMMAWLIFTACQFADNESIQAATARIKQIPGPMTEEALRYYTDCVKAACEIELQRDLTESKFFPILINDRQPPALKTKTEEAPAATFAKMPVANIERAPETPPPALNESRAGIEDLQGGHKMDIRQLSSILESLEPGDTDFEQKMSALEDILSRLREAHETSMKAAKELANSERFKAELESRSQGLINNLYEVDGLLSLGSVLFTPLRGNVEDGHADRIKSIEDMQSLLDRIIEGTNHLSSMTDIHKMPLSARVDALRKQSEITIEMSVLEEELRSAIDAADFLTTAPSGATPDTMTAPAEPAAAVVAQEPMPESAQEPAIEHGPATASELQQDEDVLLAEPEPEIQEPEPEAPLTDAMPAEQAPVTDSAEELVSTAEVASAVADISSVAAEDDAVDEDNLEVEHIDNQNLEHHFKVLSKLVNRRYYGLAGVEVKALEVSARGAYDEQAGRVIQIAKSVVNALEKMDCSMEFDFKLDDALLASIESLDITGNEIAAQVPQCLGLLAAGLPCMLFDLNGDNAWRISNPILTRLTKHQPLHDLVETIAKARQRGMVYTREQFLSSKVGEKFAFERETERFKKRAAEWKTSPDIYSNWNHSAYRKVHDLLFDKGVIGQALGFISRDDHARLKNIWDDLFRKLEKPHATLEECWKRIEDRTRPEGLYRDRAMENIDKTREFIQEYMDHVERRGSQSKPNANTQQMMLSLDRTLREAEAGLEEVEVTTAMDAIFVHSARVAIQCVRKLYEEPRLAACIPQNKQRLLLQLPMDITLMPSMEPDESLGIKPLCLASEVLEEVSRFADEDLDSDSESGIDSQLADAYRNHLLKKRFLPASLILKAGINPGGESIQLQHKRARESMEQDLKAASQRVTHAMTLDALPQSDSSQMQRVIESLAAALKLAVPIGLPDSDSIYPDFPHASAVLRQKVLDPLDLSLSDARRKLLTELDSLGNDESISRNDIGRINDMIKGDNPASLRTAHDALSMLKVTKKLPARISAASNYAKEYEAFMHEVQDTCRPANFLPALIERLKAKPAPGDEPWISGLSEDDRDDARKMVEGFLDIMNNKTVAQNIDGLNHLLRNIGISLPADYLPDNRPNRAKFSLDHQSFVFPTSSDDDMFIPPDLGSWATSLQGFALYGNHNENELRQLMQEVSTTPSLVLTRSRLSMKSRAKITSGYPALLLDEYLLAYVALHPNERLQSFMRVAILTYATNPFDDYGSRPVPQEMFFGRQSELGKLRATKGIGVLYGGRRLGKSSLLGKLHTEGKNAPNSGSAMISMYTVPTDDHVAGAWDFLYENLLNQGIIGPSSTRLTKWTQVRAHIQSQIMARKGLKKLQLLLDECDGIMSSELAMGKGDGDGFVRSLQQMVDNLEGHCRVSFIIAGLHNMARMTSEENSVLGKAEPISLKPFSSNSEDMQRGIQLIVKPLAAMGYLFPEDNQDLPLRIMSVCNFYPAFIQLYCKCLVDILSNNRQDGPPPYIISEANLDAAERDEALLSILRDKFELNLNLDKRYKAIALILADQYYAGSTSGISTGLTVTELRDLCAGFASGLFSSTPQGAFEALLDEMCELNVLEKVGPHLALRNPHIAMMMGDRARVNAKIDELSKESPERAHNYGERRPTFQCNNVQFTFPMPHAWVRRQRDVEDHQLFILTGNDMSGFKDMSRIGRDTGNVGNQKVVAMTGKGINGATEYFSKLRRTSQNDNNSTLILVVPQNAWKPEEIPEWTGVAQRAGRLNIRVLLLATPEYAAEIYRMEDASKLVYDEVNPTWKVIYVTPWSRDAVIFKLEEKVDIAENDAAINTILKATCGFGHEIEKVCNRHISLEAIERLESEMRQSIAPDKKMFFERLGIQRIILDSRLPHIEQFLAMINGERRISTAVDECREMYGVTRGEFRFLVWMGLLQETEDGAWKVPELYLSLLGKQS